MLDIEECERARVRRDRRFDGLFFSGVRTTRIYCRPVCPVRPAKAANVMFYPSAAAAELAGFRPCLRCRPEAAPFSPAWKGTRTTVERALRLIADGALDDGSVETLADRLGIGSRHLSRLFQMHLGASPVQVAQTTRVQRAKRRSPCAQASVACGDSIRCSLRFIGDRQRRSGVPANRVPRKRRLPVEADRSSAERTRLCWHVASLPCYAAIRRLSRHSGLWRGVGPADLWVHGLVKEPSY